MGPLRLLSLGAICAALWSCGAKQGLVLGADTQIAVAPASVDFGDAALGSTHHRVVTVRHLGTAGTLILDRIELLNASEDLSLGVVDKTHLEPGEEARIQVVYTARDEAPDSANLFISHNIAGSPSTLVPVTTPGQRPVLRLDRSQLNFGVVQADLPASEVVVISNIGSAAVRIVSTAFEGDVDGDFGSRWPAELAADALELAPGEHIPLIVDYAPTPAQIVDVATLRVLTVRDEVSASLPVRGRGETPILRVTPDPIRLGWAIPGSTKSEIIRIQSRGEELLAVDGVLLASAHEDLSLSFTATGAAPPPWRMPPNTEKLVQLRFEPQSEIPLTDTPLGYLKVRSNDRSSDPTLVPIVGGAGTPDLWIDPPEIVDFALVAEGITSQRAIDVENRGAVPLAVTGVRLADASTEEFAVEPVGLPMTVQPGQTRTLHVWFTNLEGHEGREHGSLVIETTDPLAPAWPLELVAERTHDEHCAMAFDPELLGLGGTKEGGVLTGTFYVVNVGSGDCIYRDHQLDRCVVANLAYPDYFQCNAPGYPNPFSVLSHPDPDSTWSPGQRMPFEVRFDAPVVADTETGRETFNGRLLVELHDPGKPGFTIAAPDGGAFKGVNVRAESASSPRVALDPTVVDFGVVRVGCESKPRQSTLDNQSPLDALIYSDALPLTSGDACTAFNLPSYADATIDIPGWGAQALPGVLIPTAAGPVSCDVELTLDDGHFLGTGGSDQAVVTFTGAGTQVAHQIDTFDVAPPAKVDVLFVIDDSGSMANEQLALKQQLPGLVDIASSWGQDYHLAVTTTDADNQQGLFWGSTVWVGPEGDLDAFANNLLVGAGGSAYERGLEAALLALSGPNVEDTGLACVDTPLACDADHWCLEGYCRGPNWGFLREDAELVVIVVSDEDDDSEAPVEHYVSLFSNLKPLSSPHGVKLNAIVPLPGCQGADEIGARYIEAAALLGGQTRDYCDLQFTKQLQEIGAHTFGPPDRLYPTLPPEPSTLTVRRDGEPCTEGFTWNEQIRAVVFDTQGACKLQPGQQVELEYDVRCGSY